jgi:hypothetical protein
MFKNIFVLMYHRHKLLDLYTDHDGLLVETCLFDLYHNGDAAAEL